MTAERRSAKSPPTIREVAALAKVSPMSVSRALRDQEGVSRQTRERVLAAARTLGYRPNEIARSLRPGHKTGMIGLVVTNLANPFYSQLALGVESVAATRDIRVLLTNTNEDEQRERDVVGDLAARQVDGMIVVPAGFGHDHLESEVPVVLAARPPSGIEADCVLVDDFGGAREATTRLVAQGHRRIGFLGNPPAVYTGAERFRGFCAALQEAGVDLDERHVRRAQQDAASAERATLELLGLNEPPTALFTANNRNTIGALRAIHKTGRRLAVGGFDDFELADMLGVPLTIVAYDADEIGRHAARLLLDRLTADPDAPPLAARRTIIPTRVIEYGHAADLARRTEET
ncbi:LacI family DNA-binding transcriptional regulator [Actinoallomurus sp. NPDC050550]|uniref:LacI family DNA-binding transcriptional regulator n=1 Tax=Actinoallomurus sp. NPDC050550 TaxID=3154937 RepID=UPI0033C00633